ncbi:unnamed protein product [Owenia fusiformis]|uniref:Uncharacterized protein n=1 Tax=Owenia fusiformis TaxID=6347 RepID=A0A8S4NMK4_OWEFU|nr:unnamed protein product [Owenia fusiformis]
MASGAQDIGQLPPKKTGAAAKWAGFVDFLWNSERKEFLGRNCMSWIQISLFYLVYYTLLAGFFGACLAIFFTTIDMNRPKYIGKDNILRDLPGMGYRPMPDFETTLIRFEQGKPSSYKLYTDHIQAFLDQYENERQVGENYVDCSNSERTDPEKVCRFEVRDLGAECTWQKDFGYDEGKPCVLLKLNKIYDWVPEALSNPNITGDPGRYREKDIMITCQGENPADDENIGPVKFWPASGMPFQFFPYRNQLGYRAPLVMAQFENPANGVVIQVRCMAWANNIYHHRNDKMGSVHFELLVD